MHSVIVFQHQPAEDSSLLIKRDDIGGTVAICRTVSKISTISMRADIKRTRVMDHRPNLQYYCVALGCVHDIIYKNKFCFSASFSWSSGHLGNVNGVMMRRILKKFAAMIQ